MRISKRHRKIIKTMEAAGYVWLSHLSPNAIMRFRNKRRKGFEGYFKVEGLTFLTRRVAVALSRGVKDADSPRMPLKQQLLALEVDLIELEKELYELQGHGFESVCANIDKEVTKN